MKKKNSSIPSFDTIASGLLAGMLILFPTVQSQETHDYALLPREAFTGAGLALILGILWVKKRFASTLAAPLGLLLGFWLWTWVCHSGAQNTAESFGAIARLSITLVGSIVVYNAFIAGAIKTQLITRLATLMALLVSAWILIKVVGLIGTGKLSTHIYELNLGFLHKNFVSSALMLTLPWVVINALEESHKNFKKLSVAVAIMILLCLVFLQTRGVWLGLFAGIGVSLLALVLSKSPHKKMLTRALGVGVGIAATGLLIALTLVGDSVFDTTNIDSRFKMWDHGIQMANENPLTGVGGGNWKINYPKYGVGNADRGIIEGTTTLIRPHNDFIWVLSEFGYPGLILFFGFMVWMALVAWRNASFHTEDFIWDYGLLFGWIAYIGYSLGEFPLERPFHQFMLILMTGLILSRSQSVSKKVLPKLPMAGVMMLIFIGGLFVTLERIKGERESKKALTAEQRRNPQKMIQYAHNAESDYFSVDNYCNPVAYFSGMGNLALRQFDLAIVDFERALEANPYHALSLNQIGNAYKLKNNTTQAMVYYDKLLEFNPRNSTALLNKAEIYLATKDIDRAVNYLNRVPPTENQEKQIRVFEGIMVSLRGKPRKPNDPMYNVLIDLTPAMANSNAQQLFRLYAEKKYDFMKKLKK